MTSITESTTADTVVEQVVHTASDTDVSGVIELALLDGGVQILVLDSDTVSLTEAATVAVVEVVDETLTLFDDAGTGPPGPQGPPGVEAIRLDSGSIAPTSTVLLDLVDALVYRGLYKLISISDDILGLYRLINMNAIHNGIAANHAVYGAVGDTIPVELQVALTGTSITVHVTNLHINPITVRSIRSRVLL